jgi:hypothetical protein
VKKKELERAYLDRFAEICDAVPRGRIEDAENPDFLVHREDGSRLGIELTQLVRQPAEGQRPMREQESLRQKILTAARAKYATTGDPPVHVSVSFSRTPLSVPQLSSIVSSLVAVVRRNVPEPGEQSAEEHDWPPRPRFEEAFERVAVSRPHWLTECFWHEPSAEWVETCSAEHLRRIVEEKGRRVRDYRLKCDEVWLLIIASGDQHSSIFDYPQQTLNGLYGGDFDRLFLFNAFGRRYFELRRQ